MSLLFKSAGTKSLGVFTADLDPNAVPPAGARILEIPDTTENRQRAHDMRWYARFTGAVGTPAVAVAVWVFDEKNSNWSRTGPPVSVADAQFKTEPGVAPARVFFQVTSLVGVATSVEFFAAAA